MTKQSHTPGWIVAAGDSRYVAIPGVVKPINCGSADRARLIAAAPELLEALKQALRDGERDGPASAMASLNIVGRAAIAKAEG